MKEPTLTEPTPASTTTPAPTPTATTTPAPNPAPVEFSAEQQAEIDRRIAAARRKAEQDAKDAAATAAAEAEAKAKAEADVKAEEAKGNYDAAKALIEQERDAAKAEAKAHEDRITAMLAMLSPGVEKRWTDLPEEVVALYEGADDDVLAKAAHLEKTDGLVAKLEGKAKERPGLPRTPNPNPDLPEKDDEAAKRAWQATYRG